MKLKQSIIDEYNEYGVVLLRNAISSYWLEQLSIGVEKNFKNPSKYKCVYEKNEKKEIFYDDYCNWQRIKEYNNFFFNSNIAKIASQLMQSNKVNIFHEHVLIKEPGATKKTPWHQDQSYYCVNGKDNCSLWIPLDFVSKEICPNFIRYSNKWNKQFLPTKFIGKSYEKHDDEFEKIPDIDSNKENYDMYNKQIEESSTELAKISSQGKKISKIYLDLKKLLKSAAYKADDKFMDIYDKINYRNKIKKDDLRSKLFTFFGKKYLKQINNNKDKLIK